jgi:hypothetical protein
MQSHQMMGTRRIYSTLLDSHPGSFQHFFRSAGCSRGLRASSERVQSFHMSGNCELRAGGSAIRSRPSSWNVQALVDRSQDWNPVSVSRWDAEATSCD